MHRRAAIFLALWFLALGPGSLPGSGAGIGAGLGASANLAAGAPATSKLCLDAVRVAASRHRIPRDIMLAITLVETRRKIDGKSRPWPWTLNFEGKGYWYDTRAEALAHANRTISSGKRSIDLGCFQLNYRWHGENFSGPAEMLDPSLAADYAARFLAGLYAETGDWIRAAGLYHSRTPVHSSRYRGLIRRTLSRLRRDERMLANLDAPATEAPALEAPLPQRRGEPTPARYIPTPQPEPGPGLHADMRSPDVQEGRPVVRRGPVLPGAVALRLFSGPSRPLIAATRRRGG